MALTGDFRRFNFGYSDAGSEFRLAPKLLQDGYYDLGGIEDKVINSHEFLLLGYKGSGKSAIGARLRLLAKNSPALFSAPPPIIVDKLPLRDFKGVVPESIESHIRHRHAWELHLMVQIMAHIAEDGRAESKSKQEVTAAQKRLTKAGVIPQQPSSLKRFKATKLSTTAGMKNVLGVTAEFERSTDEGELQAWLVYLRSVIRSFKSPRRHYIFIDGLDDLSLSREGRSRLLGGLLQATVSLNEEFLEHEAPIKIVVSCRTDLYNHLAIPQAGKIRRDYGLELNWYQNPRDVTVTHLVKLANLRARLIDSNCRDLFSEYFDPAISGRRTLDFLLLQTRHTPRDLLQLLKIIQKHVNGPGKIDERDVLAGNGDYSQTYFVSEMKDALGTYFDEDQASRIKELLGTLRQRDFSYQDIQSRVESDARFKDLDLHRVITALFDGSFIGNVTSGGATGGGDPYYRFKHRNPDASLVYEEPMQLHPGLWKTYNLA